MPEQATEPAILRPSPTPLTCRLRHRTMRRGFDPAAGEIELENTSADTVEIVVHKSPLQYLDIVVTNPTGAVVSEFYYGDLFSPLPASYTFQLAPGQKYTGPVSFVGNVSEEKLVAGKYHVQAIFQYKNWKAVSEPFPFELPGR